MTHKRLTHSFITLIFNLLIFSAGFLLVACECKNKKGGQGKPSEVTQEMLDRTNKPDQLDIYDTLIKIQKKQSINWSQSPYSQALYGAIKHSYKDIITLFINKGADANQTVNRDTPLIWAVRSGNKEVVKLLLDKGAQINAKNESNESALHIAAEKGHIEIVNILLAHEAEINNQTSTHTTPLMLAAKNGYLDVVKELLQHGAQVNLKDAHGKKASELIEHNRDNEPYTAILGLLLTEETKTDDSILYKILKEDSFNLVSLIISKLKPEAINYKNPANQHTPLMKAAILGYKDLVKLLLQHGAQVNLTTAQGFTAADLLRPKADKEPYKSILELLTKIEAKSDNQILFKAIQNNNFDLALSLIEETTPDGINYQDTNGYTPLMLAARKGDKAVITKLLEKNANANLTTVEGDTALKIAILNFQEEIAKILLDTGHATVDGQALLTAALQQSSLTPTLIDKADDTAINYQDTYGVSPLMIAAEKGDKKVIEKLLNRDAKVNLVENNAKKTALEFAIFNHKEEAARILLNKGHATVNGQTLITALVQKVALTEDLIDQAPDEAINYQNTYGTYPLGLAVEEGDTIIVDKLLARNVHINLKGHQYGKASALSIAISKNHSAIAKKLLDKGAQIGTNVLIKAIEQNNMQLFEEMIEKAKPEVINGRNAFKQSPLLVAVEKGNQAIVTKLFEKGAILENQQSASELHTTSLMHAINKEDISMIDLLLQHGANIDIQNHFGVTPLMHAICIKRKSMVQFILGKKPNLDIQDNYGDTALIRLIIMRSRATRVIFELIQLLISNNPKPNLNLKNSEGNTALMEAVNWGKKDIVKLLLDNGADINLQNNTGNTALSLAQAYNGAEKEEMIKLIQEKLAKK